VCHVPGLALPKMPFHHQSPVADEPTMGASCWEA
jgi:hypothetical protein